MAFPTIQVQTPLITDIEQELQHPAMVKMFTAIEYALLHRIPFLDVKAGLVASGSQAGTEALADPEIVTRLFLDAHPVLLDPKSSTTPENHRLSKSTSLSGAPLPSSWVSNLMSRLSGPVQTPYSPQAVPIQLDSYTIDVVEEIFRALRVYNDPIPLLHQASRKQRLPTPESYYMLFWNLWRLHNRVILGILPPNVCAIATLPIELLHLVFEFVPSSSKIHYVQWRWNSAAHLPLRLVCKHWHNVVQNTPSIWAGMVQGFGDEWTKRALGLSDKTVLDVVFGRREFTETGRHLRDTSYLLLKSTSRILSLKIAVSSWLQMTLVAAALQVAPVPVLETLEITPAPTMFHGYEIADHIFQGVPPPLLRTLTVSHCTLASTCPLLRSSLRSLNLIRCSVWTSLDAMLDTLSLLPGLEILSWDMSRAALLRLPLAVRVPQSRFSSSETHATPVPLPFMSALTLQCALPCVATILSLLSIPALCTVSLLDDYSLSGRAERDITIIDGIAHYLDTSLGAHICRPRADEASQIELRVDSYPRASGSLGSFTINFSGAARAGIVPSNTIPAESFRCTLTLSIPSAEDLEFDMDDEDSQATVHPGVLLRLMQYVLSWPAMRVMVQRFVTNHPYFSDATLWSAVFVSLPHLSHIRLENTADSEASDIVIGFSSALASQPTGLGFMSELTLGPMLHLSEYTQRMLIVSIRQWFQAGRHSDPVNVIIFNCHDIGIDSILLSENDGWGRIEVREDSERQ